MSKHPSRSAPGRAKPGKTRQPEVVVLLSGERRNKRFQIGIHGAVVELTGNLLKLFVDLVVARLYSGTGYVQAPAIEIFRLRRFIDEALGAGAGRELIETGGADEYRLTIAPDGACIGVHDDFAELAQLKVILPSVADQVLRACRRIPSSKSRFNRDEIDSPHAPALS